MNNNLILTIGVLSGILFPMICGIILSFQGKMQKQRKNLAVVFTGIEFLLWITIILLIKHGDIQVGSRVELPSFGGLGIYFILDGFRLIHVTLASFMWFVAAFFSHSYLKEKRNEGRYYLFLMLTQGALMGVFLSEGMYSVFLFFEMLSFTSFVWVAQNEKKEALKESKIYLAIGVIGGLVMLMGIFILGSSLIVYSEWLIISGVCLTFGFGAKAGIFLLHVWMPGSYTYAEASESALLSGILSKAGIYGIILVAANLAVPTVLAPIYGQILLVFGLLTMLVGGIFAILQIEVKRILAYSSMSQIGFILVGIGMYCLLGEKGGLAAGGTVLHMLNHSLVKLLLFLVAGIFFYQRGTLNINELRGYGRRKPLLHFVTLMSFLGIGGIPLWNGYISKTLLHESILEGIHSGLLSPSFLQGAEKVFLISGGLTLAYMAKIYITIFIEKNHNEELQREYDAQKVEGSLGIKGLLGITAAMLPVLGILPQYVMNLLAGLSGDVFGLSIDLGEIFYFSMDNLKGAFISLAIGVIIYVLIVKVCLTKEKEFINPCPRWFSLYTGVYKPLVYHAFPAIGGVVARAMDSITDGIVVCIRRSVYKDQKLPFELEEGTIVTYGAGKLTDNIVNLYHKCRRKKRKDSVSFVHKYAVKYTELVENNVIIARSLSFGLLMFCLGLCLTLIYVLFW